MAHPESRDESTSRLSHAILILASAGFVALATGVAEAAYLGVRQSFLGHFIWSNRHFGWMTPLSWLGFFGAMALPFALVGARWPRWPVLPVMVGGLTFLGASGFIRLASAHRLHPVAVAVLAVGVALQVGIRVHRRARDWRRIVRVGVPGLAGVVMLWGGATSFVWQWRERQATAALGVPPSGAPNILLLVLDTVRGHNMSLYGYPRQTTPVIDRLAARGTTFDWAFSTAPWTLPSHAAMFTGRWPWELSVGFLAPLDGAFPTVAERLSARGYLTAGFAANHIYATYETGLTRGFVHYEDYPLTPKQIGLSSELGQMLSDKKSSLAIRHVDRSYAETINRRFLDWLPTAAGRPYFAFLNFMDAHLPYETPADWERRFASAADRRVNRYDAALGYLDSQLGVLFDSLAARHALDNTIVIITSDHGEHLGDHGIDDHANSLYTQLLRVPLVVVWPEQIPSGRRIEAAVSLIDLAPTIMDLAGASADSGFVGSSLRRFWEADSVPGDSVLFAAVDQHPMRKSWYRNRDGPLWAAITGEHHLILNPDSTRELFRYRVDPDESANLAADPTEASLVQRLLAALRPQIGDH